MKKVWKLKTADKKWREHLLKTRKHICAKCKKGGDLQVSHYWTCNAMNTRYDDDNCDLLHFRCHYGDFQYGWEYQKQGEYRDYKINQLGNERYNALEKRYRAFKSRKDAISELMEKLC